MSMIDGRAIDLICEPYKSIDISKCIVMLFAFLFIMLIFMEVSKNELCYKK